MKETECSRASPATCWFQEAGTGTVSSSRFVLISSFGAEIEVTSQNKDFFNLFSTIYTFYVFHCGAQAFFVSEMIVYHFVITTL